MRSARALLFLLLAVLLLAGCTQAPETTPPAPPAPAQTPAQGGETSAPPVGFAEGDLAADFTLKGLDGKEYTLSDYKGTPVQLVFWSVDCVYCMKELPELQENYDGQGYEILAINATFVDGADRVKESVAQMGLTFPVLLMESQTEFNAVASAYNVGGIPHNVYVDKEGIIARVQIGATPGKDSVNLLKELAK